MKTIISIGVLGYGKEVSPLYRTQEQAERKVTSLRERNPYGEYRITYYPNLKKWVVVQSM